MSDLGLVEIAGAIIVFALLAWQIIFFQYVRPRVMARFGRRLNVAVGESQGPWDAGLYDTAESAPVGKTAAVAAADFIVTMTGTVGVLAACSIPLLLLADSGLPYRWEGQLTGASIRIAQVTVPVMADRDAVATVLVHNQAPVSIPGCRIAVADYRSRDGYLTGASPFFDLATGAMQPVALPLRVTTRIPGTHMFRISLECGERLRDRVGARLQVGS